LFENARELMTSVSTLDCLVLIASASDDHISLLAKEAVILKLLCCLAQLFVLPKLILDLWCLV
jgi:hypothetical protein